MNGSFMRAWLEIAIDPACAASIVAVIVYGTRLTATEVVRTQEFVGQHGTDAFGSITASFNF